MTNSIDRDTAEFQPLVSYERKTPPNERDAGDNRASKAATAEVEEILKAAGFQKYDFGGTDRGWITPMHVARIYAEGEGGDWSSTMRIQGVAVERSQYAAYYWADLQLQKSELKPLADQTRTAPEFVGYALQTLLTESRRQHDSGEHRPLSGCLCDAKMVANLGIPADQPQRLHQLMLCKRPTDGPEFEAKLKQIAEYVPCDAEALRDLLMGTRPLSQWSTKLERESHGN